jgi:hypothetical protein
MKRWAIMLVAALAICVIGLRHHSRQAIAQANAGWTVLFDGKTMNGWNPIGTANWKVEDGALVADNGNGFLVSKDSYTDFQLRASSGSRTRPIAASSFAAPIRTA